MTPQRRAVAEVLEGENVHLSAEAVHHAARERVPEISLATVYNTLHELASMGEVLEVSAAGGPMLYDPNVHVPHHHLLCTSCGDLRDVPPSAVEVARPASTDLEGYQLTGVEVTFRGVCPRCA
jgi:Fur family transcriptional regulator, stress-responsive regulator